MLVYYYMNKLNKNCTEDRKGIEMCIMDCNLLICNGPRAPLSYYIFYYTLFCPLNDRQFYTLVKKLSFIWVDYFSTEKLTMSLVNL